MVEPFFFVGGYSLTLNTRNALLKCMTLVYFMHVSTYYPVISVHYLEQKKLFEQTLLLVKLLRCTERKEYTKFVISKA